jgi:hypothetical protein
VQAVGQLDEHHSDVVDHGEHHLAQVLGLLLFLVAKSILLILVTPSTMCDLLAEFLADVDDRDRSVLDRIGSSPAATATGSIFISASTSATSSGWTRYGSPDARLWPA